MKLTRRRIPVILSRRRVVNVGDGIGPLYPSVSGGLVTLDDADTGNRFNVTAGLATVDNATGNVARLATSTGAGKYNGQFYLSDS